MELGRSPRASDLTKARTRILNTIVILSFLGIVLSAISLQRHYATSKSSYCDFGANFNCDMVNRSIYSEILGLPVASIGVLGYCSLVGFAVYYLRRNDAPTLLFAASAAGLSFALYLTYLEGLVLEVWCILCLSSLALITMITTLAGLIWVRWSE
jgi:uncharacterized membrane protein